MVGRTTIIDELESKYDLTYGLLPKDENPLFEKIDSLLSRNDLKDEWKAKKEKLLSEKVDFTEWIINHIEKYKR